MIVSLIKILCLFGAFVAWLLFVSYAVDFYMSYRADKILDFLNANPGKYDVRKIITAHQKFWVWPIRKMFE